MNIYSCFLFFHVSPVAATTGLIFLMNEFYFWGGTLCKQQQ